MHCHTLHYKAINDDVIMFSLTDTTQDLVNVVITIDTETGQQVMIHRMKVQYTQEVTVSRLAMIPIR